MSIPVPGGLAVVSGSVKSVAVTYWAVDPVFVNVELIAKLAV